MMMLVRISYFSVMKPLKMPRKHTVDTVTMAVHDDSPLPRSLSADAVKHELINNKRIQWKANMYLLHNNLVEVLLGEDHRLMKVRRALLVFDWIIILAVAIMAFASGVYTLLWGIGIYAVFNPLKLLPPFIVVLIGAGVGYYITSTGPQTPVTWILFSLAGISYTTAKIKMVLTEAVILHTAKVSPELFWRYYKHQIVIPALDLATQAEVDSLTERFPDLNLGSHLRK